jgi:hypothetical protein
MVQDEIAPDPSAGMDVTVGAVALAILGFGRRWLSRLAMATFWLTLAAVALFVLLWVSGLWQEPSRQSYCHTIHAGC